MDSYSLAILERKREDINRLARDVAYSYLSNIRLSNDFIHDEHQLAEFCINEYRARRLSFSNASAQLNEQYKILYDRNIDLKMGSAKLFAIAERKKEQNSITTIILKQVGFVSGWLQMIGGGGVCYSSLGLACGSLGTPMFLHGAENAWENGYYLLYREDPHQTPLRKAYRYSAALLGGDDKSGDIAYSTVDLTLSTAAMFRSVLKPDAWKIFYYIRDDYVIGWREMGAAGLTSELVGDSATGFSLYQLINDNNSSQWNNLSEK